MQSLSASPTMVGAATTLIVVVAVFLAYNANAGLPFVPVYRVSVDVPNAARLLGSNEVRIGGHRVGLVESIEPVRIQGSESRRGDPGRGAGGGVAARLNLKLDKTAEPLPRDSIFRIRYKSTFGLKYLEVVRGTGPAAPEGYTFDGTDDEGVCKLPVNLESFADGLAQPARNGCFQEQAEFDDLGNTFDRRTRQNVRTNLVELGGALAGRGDAVSVAIASLRPFLEDLRPVARTLADPDADLERYLAALSRTATALSPVAEEAAQLFTAAAIAFEAVSRHPAALGDAISEAVPLLEEGTPALRRARSLLADTAELARRLGPGAEALPAAVPALNEALAVGAPALRRAPSVAPGLREALVELRRAVDQLSTKVTLQRLGETLDRAKPLAAHVVPAQTVCNYWNYWFTLLPEHLSERSTVGFTQRVAVVAPHPPDIGSVSIAGIPIELPGWTRMPMGGYSGVPAGPYAGDLPDPREKNVFKPRQLPMLHAPVNAPTGQLTDEFPDCVPGQFGYPLGELRVPGQPAFHPAIAVGDYPGSVGPTTVFFRRDGSRELRDTRVPSRSPTTWEIGP